MNDSSRRTSESTDTRPWNRSLSFPFILIPAPILLVAWMTGCHNLPGDAVATTEQVLFDLDVRDSGTLEFRQSGNQLEASFVVEEGTVLLPGGQSFSGTGRVEQFSIAGMKLYKFDFPGQVLAEGPCGQEAVTYRLALVRRQENAKLSGSLSIYCGVDPQGEQPVQLLKITGRAD